MHISKFGHKQSFTASWPFRSISHFLNSEPMEQEANTTAKSMHPWMNDRLGICQQRRNQNVTPVTTRWNDQCPKHLHTDPDISAAAKVIQDTKIWEARIVAKSDGLKSGSTVIKVKAGSIAKRVVPVAVNPVRVVGLTQLVTQQWRNAKVRRAKPQHAKRLHQRRWIGRIKTNNRHLGLLQSDGHFLTHSASYLQCR